MKHSRRAMAGVPATYVCPRDGAELVPPSASERSAYIRNGIHHCETCSGMLLNADAAASSFCSEKLQEMHEGFVEEGTPDDIDCPFCESQMKVRSFSFQRLNYTRSRPWYQAPLDALLGHQCWHLSIPHIHIQIHSNHLQLVP